MIHQHYIVLRLISFLREKQNSALLYADPLPCSAVYSFRHRSIGTGIRCTRRLRPAQKLEEEKVWQTCIANIRALLKCWIREGLGKHKIQQSWLQLIPWRFHVCPPSNRLSEERNHLWLMKCWSQCSLFPRIKGCIFYRLFLMLLKESCI